MRRQITAIAVMLLVSVVASAQSDPPAKYEIFAGYSFMRLDRLPDAQNHNGWNGSFTVNLNRRFGLKADFGGNYHSGTSTFTCPASFGPPCPITTVFHNRSRVHTFLFGPQFGFQLRRTRPFAHVLVGFAHDHSVTTSTGSFGIGDRNQFAMAFGGGLDLAMGKRLAFRAIQVDYLPVRVDQFTGWQQNVRISTGLVFRLGK